MNDVVIVGFWASLGLYGVASVAFVWTAILRREGLLPWAVGITVVGFAVHTAAVAARWLAAGRPPFVEPYENALVGSWAITVAFIIVALRRPRLRVAGVLVVPFVLLTMGYGAVSSPAIPVFLDAYKSEWLVIHVVFAWFTYASYTVAAGAAVVELLRTRAERRGRADAGFYTRLPAIPAVQDTTLRLVALGFITNAVMIVSGAIWAYRLWGSYWSWDPVESWSLITWLWYGLYLHLRLTRGWRGPKLAWIAVIALVGVTMMFWGVQLFPTTYHLFQRMGTGRLPQPL